MNRSAHPRSLIRTYTVPPWILTNFIYPNQIYPPPPPNQTACKFVLVESHKPHLKIPIIPISPAMATYNIVCSNLIQYIKCLDKWKHRKLSLLGKITVIKTFAAPKLIYPIDSFTRSTRTYDKTCKNQVISIFMG